MKRIYAFTLLGCYGHIRSMPLRQPNFGNRVQFSDFVGVRNDPRSSSGFRQRANAVLIAGCHAYCYIARQYVVPKNDAPEFLQGCRLDRDTELNTSWYVTPAHHVPSPRRCLGQSGISENTSNTEPVPPLAFNRQDGPDDDQACRLRAVDGHCVGIQFRHRSGVAGFGGPGAGPFNSRDHGAS